MMSQRNGDKSRFHRERKQNILRRRRTRELLKAEAGLVVQPGARKKVEASTASGQGRV
jgi:hypothetical protein